jgi:hypothetical protein
MLQRGVIVSYEAVRRWCATFGRAYADGLRRRPRPGPAGRASASGARHRGEAGKTAARCAELGLPSQPERLAALAAEAERAIAGSAAEERWSEQCKRLRAETAQAERLLRSALAARGTSGTTNPVEAALCEYQEQCRARAEQAAAASRRAALTLRLPRTSSVQVMRHACTRGGCRQAKAIVPAYVEASDRVLVGYRCRERAWRAGVGDAVVRPMCGVELFELAQRGEQGVLVPGRGPVGELAAAGRYRPRTGLARRDAQGLLGRGRTVVPAVTPARNGADRRCRSCPAAGP